MLENYSYLIEVVSESKKSLEILQSFFKNNV